MHIDITSRSGSDSKEPGTAHGIENLVNLADRETLRSFSAGSDADSRTISSLPDLTLVGSQKNDSGAESSRDAKEHSNQVAVYRRQIDPKELECLRERFHGQFNKSGRIVLSKGCDDWFKAEELKRKREIEQRRASG